jgi:hypothetical protein
MTELRGTSKIMRPHQGSVKGGDIIYHRFQEEHSPHMESGSCKKNVEAHFSVLGILVKYFHVLCSKFYVVTQKLVLLY